MIPDFSSISPECCLSNSSSDPNQSTEIYAPLPLPECNLSNVDADQAKKKKKPRSTSWNSRFAKGRKSKNGEGPDKSDCRDNLNLIPEGGRGRKRNHEATVEGDGEKNNTSSADLAVQPELHNKKDHVMAERKRREKLTQRFIALSSLVPGLTRVCAQS
jgi:hypothetical protein